MDNNLNQEQQNNYVNQQVQQQYQTDMNLPVSTKVPKSGLSKLFIGLGVGAVVAVGSVAMFMSSDKESANGTDNTTTTTKAITNNENNTNNNNNKLVVNDIDDDNYDSVFKTGLYADWSSLYYSLGIADVVRDGDNLKVTFVNEDGFYGSLTGTIKKKVDPDLNVEYEYIEVNHPKIKEIQAILGEVAVIYHDTAASTDMEPIDNDFELNGIYTANGENYFVLLIEQDLDYDYDEEGYELFIGREGDVTIDVNTIAKFNKEDVNKYISINGDKIVLKNGELPVGENNTFNVVIDKNSDGTYKFDYQIDGIYDENGKYNKCSQGVENCDYFDFLDGNYTRVK